MNWCKSCLLPNTRPNIFLNSDGICNACVNHKTKKTIDWDARAKHLEEIVKKVKKKSATYDCVIPVSGGKDSTWQTIKCLEMGLKPLAVTWKPPGRTAIGQENLNNLINLGVDHIDYSISPKVESKFMLSTFKEKGSIAIPMHLALFNIPLKIASKFNIPLVVWGENSAFEYGEKDKSDTGLILNQSWVKKYGVTNGTSAKDWISENLSKRDLIAYEDLSDLEFKQNNIKAIFLGYFLKWDPEITKQVSLNVGFKTDPNGPRTGYYSHADIDDDYISIHHWLKWYKFGFTRTFDNLSIEIRNKRIEREEAIKIISKNGDETPYEDIEKFCKFVDITKKEFFQISEKFRNKNIWKKNSNDVWYLPNFLIPNWSWKNAI